MPIEVQDCSYYALVIYVRSGEEYEDDHITGAVSLTPTRPSSRPLADGDVNAVSPLGLMAKEVLPTELASLLEKFELDQGILVYCGREATTACR